MDTIIGFFDKLYTELGDEHSLFIIFFMLVSFLIGLIFGWWQGARGKRRLRKSLRQKESEFIALQAEHKNLTEQLELKEADLTKANLEIEELKTKISQIEHQKVQLRNELFEKNSEIENLQAEHNTNLLKITELTEQIVALENNAAQQSEIINNEVHSNTLVDVDLSKIQDNYDTANIRLAAIEQKLSRMERENLNLRSELASLQDSSTAIAFVDEEPADEDEVVELKDAIEEVNEMIIDPEERSALARQRLKAAFGERIDIASLNESDDLKLIVGVGPFIEQKLNEIGIFTFKQISQLDAELIQQITDAIQFFPGRIERDDWVGQAKKLS